MINTEIPTHGPSCFTAEYYQRNYHNYAAQNPESKLSFYRRMVEKHASPGAPRRIHDMGCAFGRFLSSLDKSWEIFGSDVSGYAIQKAREICPRGRFAISDGSPGNPFGTTFGAVTAFDVLEHMPDPDAVAEAVRSQLAPEGLFIFAVPVYDGLSGPLIRLLDRDPTHIHQWPRRKWLEWAARRFNIVTWTGILRYLLPGGVYLHMPTRMLRKHVPAIAVVGRVR